MLAEALNSDSWVPKFLRLLVVLKKVIHVYLCGAAVHQLSNIVLCLVSGSGA